MGVIFVGFKLGVLQPAATLLSGAGSAWGCARLPEEALGYQSMLVLLFKLHL